MKIHLLESYFVVIKSEQIELLELEKSDIHVAKYLTILPPKEEFEKRLHKAIQNAKEKYQNRG